MADFVFVWLQFQNDRPRHTYVLQQDSQYMGMGFQSQNGRLRQEVSSATSAKFLLLTCIPLGATNFVDSLTL